MNSLLFYLAESGACLLVFYLLYALVLKQETCFDYTRFYLLATSFLAFVLPLVEVPSLSSPGSLAVFFRQPLDPVIITATAAAQTRATTLFTWQTTALMLYAAGVSFFAFRLGRQLYHLHLFSRQTQADSFYWNGIRVSKTNGRQPTFSFGNRIFWDNSQPLSAAETEQILQHEAVHVRQHHSWDILYLEIVHLLFWFNPLLYLYKKALVSTHEYMADAAVLQTTGKEAYARLLVKQLFHRLEFSLGHYFNKSLTLKRMHMIRKTHRPSKVKQLLALPVLGLLVWLLSSGNTPENGNITHKPATVANPEPTGELLITPEKTGSGYETKSTAAPLPSRRTASVTTQNEPVFTIVEQLPLFPGGSEKMQEFLGKNIKYPAAAKKAKLEGIVVAQFVVTKEGKIKDIKIVKNLSAETDAETIRVIKMMPAWEPGKQNGAPVNVQFTLPVFFSIGAGDPDQTGKTGFFNWAKPLQDRC